MKTGEGWELFKFMGRIHVEPVNDMRTHTHMTHCWCKPCPDEVNRNVIIHNSMDRRELHEGNRLQ